MRKSFPKHATRIKFELMPDLKVDAALTRQVAKLAQLELTEEEVCTFTRQLADILGYVAELETVPTQGIAPLLQPFDFVPVLRDDVVVPCATDSEERPKVLQSAPEVLHDGFKVPQIL